MREKKFASEIVHLSTEARLSERELWLDFYHRLWAYARRIGHRSPHGTIINDVIIAAVHHWAVLHDRPDCWACKNANWQKPESWLPFIGLPSQSSLSRRMRSDSVKALLDGFAKYLAHDVNNACDTLVKTVDSKPLPVGRYSNAKDARWGEATKVKLRGYKLFCLYGRGVMPIAFEVSSMNASDQRVGCRLVRQLAGTGTSGYVLGDGGFDPNRFYAECRAANHQALAPRRHRGYGIKEETIHPDRRRAIELLEGEPDGEGNCSGGSVFGKTLYGLRSGIERKFSQLTGTGGGLGPLPNWVRWLPRVRRWVRAKLLLHAVRHLPKLARKQRTYVAAA